MIVRVYDSLSEADIKQLSQDIVEVLSVSEEETELTEIEEKGDLIGIPADVYAQINAVLKAGKRHVILYGPPGTGKTTLAEHVAQSLSPSGSYELLTASSSWSSQDLIGGYQPMGEGKIGFVPGAMLQNFDKPVIIDELNRCPIDKVIGPLFSVLSGQRTKLPYRVEVSQPDSDFYSILPENKKGEADYEYCPTSAWHIIGTLNTIDKSSLGQISYALARRFAWIKVGIPENLEEFVSKVLEREGVLTAGAGPTAQNPVAAMWREINNVRELGGAPIIDFIRIAKLMKGDINFQAKAADEGSRSAFLSGLRMFFLPLLDGIQKGEAEALAENISAAVGFDEKYKALLRSDFNDIAL